MTEEQVRAVLLRRSKKEGPTAWALAHGLHKGRVSEFLNGKRKPGPAILDALGLEYRIVRKQRESCPFCTDRSTYKGDPAKAFCAKHYASYRATVAG